MTENAREAKRAYERRWRQEHPDKVREIRERYWERKAQKEKQIEKKEGDENGRPEIYDKKV